MKTSIELYRRGKNWRWRMIDRRSGNIIGASTEGYRNCSMAFKNLNRVTGRNLNFTVRRGERRYQWTSNT
jgi:hypothetical protein